MPFFLICQEAREHELPKFHENRRAVGANAELTLCAIKRTHVYTEEERRRHVLAGHGLSRELESIVMDRVIIYIYLVYI